MGVGGRPAALVTEELRTRATFSVQGRLVRFLVGLARWHTSRSTERCPSVTPWVVHDAWEEGPEHVCSARKP